MRGSNVYDELVEHLNSMPIGAPKTPELIETTILTLIGDSGCTMTYPIQSSP